MRDSVKWRKQSSIIMLLAEKLQIDPERALDIFYSSKTYELFSDPSTGLQTMSDLYIVEDVLNELQNR